MGPDISLTCLKKPATCLNSESDKSSPPTPIQFLGDPVQYHLPIYAWVFQVVLFFNFPLQNLVYISFLSLCAVHTPSFSHSWFGF